MSGSAVFDVMCLPCQDCHGRRLVDACTPAGLVAGGGLGDVHGLQSETVVGDCESRTKIIELKET